MTTSTCETEVRRDPVAGWQYRVITYSAWTDIPKPIAARMAAVVGSRTPAELTEDDRLRVHRQLWPGPEVLEGK